MSCVSLFSEQFRERRHSGMLGNYQHWQETCSLGWASCYQNH